MVSKESFTHTIALLQTRWTSTIVFYISTFTTTTENEEEQPNKCFMSAKLAIKH